VATRKKPSPPECNRDTIRATMPAPSRTAGPHTKQLESENEEMAIRLRELKASLRKRKEARGSGVIWRSGGRGGLRNHAADVLDGRRAGNVRPPNNRRPSKGDKTSTTKGPATAALRPRPPAGPRPSAGRPTAGAKRVAHPPLPQSAVEILPGPPSDDDIIDGETGMSTGPGPEEYDEATSHASFLEALNDWRSGRSPETTAAAADTATSASASATIVGGALIQGAWAPVHSEPTGGALLEGNYDEEAAAASFRSAVEAWRCGSAQGTRAPPAPTQRPATAAAACSAQTVPPPQTPIEITFTKPKKLSFVEQMMLKRVRSAAGRVPTASVAAAAVVPPPAGPTKVVSSDGDTAGRDCLTGSDYVSVVEVHDATDVAPHPPSSYAVEEPEDVDAAYDAADLASDVDKDQRAPLVITPEWSQGDPEESMSATTATIAVSSPSPVDTKLGAGSELEELEQASVDQLRSGLTVGFGPLGSSSPDPHGRHIITPSLMDDFEEMERSFCEP